jgi:hypothetical protein
MRPAVVSRYIIAGFALIKFLIPFLLIHPQFELHRDEYLYLADADHLTWGYIEMPPLLAVMGAISKLFGGSVYTVYFWGGFTGALTMWLVGKIVLQLKGNITAVFFACLAFLCAGFLRMHILFQPNVLDVLFWTWSSYCIVCWIDTDQKKWLYWLGICFGLGMLGKYSMAFYIIGFLIAVILTNRRKWLYSPHFFRAMLLGLLICLPNLIWQYTHDFPVMHHMALLKKSQLQYNSRVDFIINQFIVALPAVFIWLGGLWYIFANPTGRKYIAIGIIYFSIIALLLYFNGKPYYAMAIYPSIMAFGGIWFSLVTAKKYTRWLAWVMPLLMLFLSWRFLALLVPFQSPEALAAKFSQSPFAQKSGLLKWEDGKNHPLPQDFADMLGWKEMAEKTARVYNSLPDSVKAQTMVYGDNYGEAGALAFYGRKLGLPEIHSDNASYVFWLPKTFTKKYFLFVTDDMPDADDAFFHHWGKVEIRDSVTQRYAREFNAKIILYSQPDDSVRIIAEQHINADRKRFNLK